ncbi:MAG: acyl carrier protein [Spirochaetales bacterium]|nr:acyl carrier protein [Spirochaetales bacterium]
MDIDTLKNEIKDVIITSLELEGMTRDEIKDDEALFGEGLELDSVDALELGIALKKHFGVSFSSENGENRKYFASVSTLADYISAHMER